MLRRGFMAVLACLTAFQVHALGGETGTDTGKVSAFLERRAQRQADEIERSSTRSWLWPPRAN